MGSINDYLRSQRSEKRPLGRKLKSRLLGQIALSLVLFLIIAASVGADNIFGDSARYVVGEGISQDSSWINFNNWGNNDKDGVVADEDAVTAQADATGDEEVAPVDDGMPPDFTAPASGIVVTDVAVAAGGFATQKGILIQGNAGQTVKAAAAGSVTYLGESEDGYIVELSHSGGFTSVYQGLSAVEVTDTALVNAGDPIGVTADGELTFSLLLNGEEVNPLEYLFD